MWTKNGLNSYLCPMPTIKFYIQSDKKPAGIYVRLREGRNIDAKAKTNYAINPLDWNNKKQRGAFRKTKIDFRRLEKLDVSLF